MAPAGQLSMPKSELQTPNLYKSERGIYFVALAHIVGWVKRDTSAIYVGFAYLREPQKFEIAPKLANPTILVADRRLNPTYDLSFRPTKWIPPKSEITNYKPQITNKFQISISKSQLSSNANCLGF